MEHLDILIIKSSFENLEKLQKRIYLETEKAGYFNVITETKNGIEKSIFIFNELKNKSFLETLIAGYTYLNNSDIYFGKIKKIEEYVATEFNGSPIRIKIYLENNDTYDIPIEAKEHLNIPIAKMC